MIRVSQIKLSPDHTENDLRLKLAQILRIPADSLKKYEIKKKSVDARKKDGICLVYTVDVSTDRDEQILKHNRNKAVSRADDIVYRYPAMGTCTLSERPVIIGTGPAGMFAAYFLAINGYRPIVLERGSDVRTRIKDVEPLPCLRMW